MCAHISEQLSWVPDKEKCYKKGQIISAHRNSAQNVIY